MFCIDFPMLVSTTNNDDGFAAYIQRIVPVIAVVNCCGVLLYLHNLACITTNIYAAQSQSNRLEICMSFNITLYPAPFNIYIHYINVI